MKRLRSIVHASEVLTGTGVRRRDGRKVQEEDLGRIEDGALVYSTLVKNGKEIPQRIEWVGKTSELPKKWMKVKAQNLRQKRAVIPGMVDCHTHLIFAGDRSTEFAERCTGKTYAEIAASGGGIQSTVRATRAASSRKLEKQSEKYLKQVYAYGVRTIEIKSGYGLTQESEFKQLQVIRYLKTKFPEMTLKSTFLGAHAIPSDRNRTEYIAEICDQMLPKVAAQRLADACDVFIDEGYFNLEEGRKILSRASDLNMNVKVHADELANTESASLAAEIGALSADHLLRISENGIRDLAQSQTVAVLLPGTAFYLKAEYAPARKLIDAGVAVALATDFNPGTCMTVSLPVIMTLAALYMKMSRSEIFAGVTYNGAKALGLSNRKGTLEKGKDADFSILPFARFEEIYYRFAWVP